MPDSYNGVPVPRDGARINYRDGRCQAPPNPIIPFIEGDGTGRDIWKASVRVFDAAVEKAYAGQRRVAWYEIFAGEKAKAKFNDWLPQDSIDAIKEFRDSLPQRHSASGTRSLFLHSPSEVLQRHALAGEEPRAHGYRHLP